MAPALSRSAIALRSLSAVLIRTINNTTNSSVNPTAMISSGASIEMSIRGPPILMTLAG
jgi:hypothetical protein